MARPALPEGKFSRGDRVILSARRGERSIEAIVTGCGPKWLHAVDPKWFGHESERSFVRRFLLRDQGEGEPGQRVGYGTYFATHEQHEYDLRLAQAARVVTDCGLDIRRDSVFYGDDGLFRLASILRRAVIEDAPS